ncbi:RHS repeat-associated core domain-containing protein [Streptomyces sp. NPDC088910]|uniref:RHS repeat-associated core domain-containing protein n=1 Tax=Streptomyces sp. NPDC088910 TaxID=3365911 RepID=UPI00382A79EC
MRCAAAIDQRLTYDEFGNPETLTAATLMGVRLYDPTTGRFLQTDPIPGGNANANEYCNGDPVNCYDLDGKFGSWHWRNPIHVSRWSPLHRGWGSVAKNSWKWTKQRTRHYSPAPFNSALRYTSTAFRNHYFRACLWGGASGIGISAVAKVAKKLLPGALLVGCAVGAGQYRWN